LAHKLPVAMKRDCGSKFTGQANPMLRTELDDYALAYADAYGDRLSVELLVPAMLEALLSSDSGFKRAKRAIQR
jgi:hypothetical protein